MIIIGPYYVGYIFDRVSSLSFCFTEYYLLIILCVTIFFILFCCLMLGSFDCFQAHK